MRKNNSRPVSWLLLEQYHLGELSKDEQISIEKRMQNSQEDQRALQLIREDERPLPQLKLEVEEAVVPTWQCWNSGWGMALAATAAIVVLGLATVLNMDPEERAFSDFPAASIQVKGGNVAISLVRERNGHIVENPRGYSAGDRFQIRATCPPAGESPWEVVVFQSDELYFPLDSTRPLFCGNHVSLPGAFRLDGDSPAVVCFVCGKNVPTVTALRQSGPQALPERTACVVLMPLGQL